MASRTTVKGSPTVIATACSAVSASAPPPNSSAAATTPSITTQNTRCTVGASTLPPAVIASIVPFLTTRGDNSFELARWLLRMNRDMYQCKFAYDEDGDVVLTVELPTESLDSSEVETALTSLVRHAAEHRATLRAAAAAAI